MFGVWEFRKQAVLAEAHVSVLNRDDACPSLRSAELLRTLLAKGDVALHEGFRRRGRWMQRRLRSPADRLRCTPILILGKAITIALWMLAFISHPDQCSPKSHPCFADATHIPVSVSTLSRRSRRTGSIGTVARWRWHAR